MVFGKPLLQASGDATTVFTYALRPRHPGGRQSTGVAQRPFIGFRLHFLPDGVLVRIETFKEDPIATTV